MRIFATACAVVGVLALGAGTASAQSSAYCHDKAMSIANQYANPVAGAVGGAVGKSHSPAAAGMCRRMPGTTCI